MKGYIYKISNNINSKVYIGKTNLPINERFRLHCVDSTKRICEKRPLYNAMNKYGIDKFYIELVEEFDNIDNDELNKKEIYWIEYYHSYSNGYNATLGGDGRTLYDYDYIVQQYLDGKLCKEIMEELHCDQAVIRRALKNAGINSNDNNYSQLKQPLVAYFQDNTEKIFDSVTNAALWLKENNYTSAKDINGIVANIGRVASGKTGRLSYLKIKWKYL